MKILVYPTSENPYIHQLYTNILNLNEDITVKFVNGEKYEPIGLKHLFSFPLKLLYFRLKGYRIFHLHWPNFRVPIPYFSEILSFLNSLLFISLIKLFGFKLVWTIHNIIPHEKQTVNDWVITFLLCKFSDAKIVHSKCTISDMQKKGLNIQHIFIVPLGNFIDTYKNSILRSDARKYFGLNSNHFILLFFGFIRPYKGVKKLISEFNKLACQNNSLRLIIAGNYYDENYINNLISLTNHKTTLMHSKTIEDDKLQYYFNCSDVIVLPFKQITTSSSVILALSFKKAVVVPKIGSIRDIPEDLGYFYNPDNPNGLKNAMKKAINNPKLCNQKGQQAYLYVKTLTWNKIAYKTVKIYHSLL